MKLQPDAWGRLVLTTPDGVEHVGVVPVRAYPISAPEGLVSIMGADGHELAWVEHLSDLPADTRALIEQELARREFTPEIRRLVSVSSFATPSTWQVETDRGPATLVLKGEEDIRRMGAGVLLIADTHGVNFMIRRLADLDRHSRKLLDRFL